MHKIPLRKIAKNIGVTESCVNHVLKGRGKSKRVLQAVAVALGMTFDDLWGSKDERE